VHPVPRLASCGIDWTSAGDKVVPIDVFDAEGKKVFSARITMNAKLAD
jgi:hypothetical protein